MLYVVQEAPSGIPLLVRLASLSRGRDTGTAKWKSRSIMSMLLIKLIKDIHVHINEYIYIYTYAYAYIYICTHRHVCSHLKGVGP